MADNFALGAGPREIPAKKRILLLDDEASILDILSHHFSEELFDCHRTTSARHALELLQGQSFDLLITDLRMPEMSGIDVMQQALAADPTLAVIVVTAMLEVTSAIEALRVGAADYLLKPFNLRELSVAVSRALERRRLLVENQHYQTELETRVRAATAELETTNRELRRTKEYLERLIQSSVDTIVTIDPEGRITFANQAAEHMLGFSEQELIGRNVQDFFAGGKEEAFYLRRLLQEDRPLQNFETELVHKDGAVVPINMSISLVRDGKNKIVSLLGIWKDITPQKRLEAELKEMSIKDSLTGLYNQRYFYDRLEQEIERAQRQGHPLSLLLFDIDHFKPYNDLHGHLEGDQVLKSVGQVVLECTREHVDIGFRYGGDEFTVILPEAGEAHALRVAERIRTTFAGRRFDQLTVSIGLMTYKKGNSLRSFVRFADAMMYDAKRSGGNRVYVYDLERDQERLSEDMKDQPQSENSA